MATMKIEFFSQSLMRTVTVNAIVPVDKMIIGEKATKKKLYKTLYLLHGIFGNYTDWLHGTRIERWANERDLVVIMPSGDNTFYVDNELSREYYSKFIGEELVEFTRRLLPLSSKKEDTFIGGLSMGGYGALVNGLKYYATFGYICGLSSALKIEDFVNSKYQSNEMIINDRGYLESVFGDLDQLKGSDKDYEYLATLIDQKDKPKIYLCCGEDDDLLKNNVDYHDFLREHHYDVTFEVGPGNHEWDFWDRYIKNILDWLPLDDKLQGINSGNVTCSHHL